MNYQAFAEQGEIFAEIYYFVNRKSPGARMSYKVSVRILQVWIQCKDFFQSEKVLKTLNKEFQDIPKRKELEVHWVDESKE